MNNIVGIVAEFNPIHYGHCYLIEEARKRASADGVACVMSGDFVQRGAPAVYDKWTRTKMALDSGADLVVEIPTMFCLSNASSYAKASVHLLEGIGAVSHITFGSETGNLRELQHVAKFLSHNRAELDQEISANIKSGKSYPAARQEALRRMTSIDMTQFSGPNDTLALEYLQNVSRLKPIAVKRINSGYHDVESYTESGVNRYFSSTSVREHMRNGDNLIQSIPWKPEDYPKPSFNDDKWFDLIRYAVLTNSVDTLEEAPGGGEGLGNRLKEVVRTVSSIDELIQNVKSKRYTYTRISRWLYQILLGIQRNDLKIAPEYIRILGFNEKGREIIRYSQKNSLNSFPFIVNINKQHIDSKQLAMDLHASDIYNLACGNSIRGNSDYCQQIIIK